MGPICQVRLSNRNIGIGIFSGERSAVGLKEQPHGEKSGSLVAVRQRVIPSQMLDQDRCFLDQRGICVLIAEAGPRRGKGRLRQGILGKRTICSGVVPSNSAAISQ